MRHDVRPTWIVLTLPPLLRRENTPAVEVHATELIGARDPATVQHDHRRIEAHLISHVSAAL